MYSSGASRTCSPRTPAEIEITSNRWAVSSRNTGYKFLHAKAVTPPRM
jgi:hypothetical protein